jgi:alkylated DNA repair dioxygenase AlkB
MTTITFNKCRASNNILNKDGIVNYYGKILSSEEANQYFELLMRNIQWENDDLVFFGKHVATKRKVTWYGDSEYLYTYSNTTKQALAWTKELFELKQIVEKYAGIKFNSCLLNLYHNGNTIASLSFGAERTFSFKHKQTKQIISLVLEHGSLLIMKDATQSSWLHSLHKSKNVTQPRINLTFRVINNLFL